MRILVVEDTPTQAAMIKLGLKGLNHEVVIARDGIEAIEKAYHVRPDLIVSDVIMPRLNGYQVCRLLKDDKQTSAIPVVLLTSLDQRQDVFWGLKSGADKYITKGGDIPELVREIQSFIDEWYEKALPGKDAMEPADLQGDIDFDVMERVIKLLDQNLFESTVTNEIQNLVNILDDYKKTITSVLEILSKVVDFHVGCVILSEDRHHEFHYLINRSVDRSFLSRLRQVLEERIPEEDRHGEFPIDVEEEIHDPQDLLKESGDHPREIRSSISTGLLTRGRSSGCILLASGEEKAHADRTAHTFEIICRQANIVIDYARLYERNKKLSITDGLTKVYNHRHFQEQLGKEFNRSARHNSFLSLIMLDIDHFKRFNDTYGHQQGDIVLRELARVLHAKIREGDFLARYGGEEFTIIMPETDSEVALQIAKRLRTTVKNHAVPGQEEELKITISMGIATIPNPDITKAAELVTAADQALYRAKEKGRDRVEC